MKPLTVSYTNGMVNIDNEDIAFSLIPDMYKNKIPGVGLQINPPLDRDKVEKMCVKIANAVMECHDKTLEQKVAERLSGIVRAAPDRDTLHWNCPKCEIHYSTNIPIEGVTDVVCKCCGTPFSVAEEKFDAQ